MYNNKHYYVLDASHHAMGRGRGVINAKLRDIISGSVIPVTFKAGEDIIVVDTPLGKLACQFVMTYVFPCFIVKW